MVWPCQVLCEDNILTVDNERIQKSFLHGEAEETVGDVSSVYPVCPELYYVLSVLLGEHPPSQPVSGLHHPHTQSCLDQLGSSGQSHSQTSALCSGLGSSWWNNQPIRKLYETFSANERQFLEIAQLCDCAIDKVVTKLSSSYVKAKESQDCRCMFLMVSEACSHSHQYNCLFMMTWTMLKL